MTRGLPGRAQLKRVTGTASPRSTVTSQRWQPSSPTFAAERRPLSCGHTSQWADGGRGRYPAVSPTRGNSARRLSSEGAAPVDLHCRAKSRWQVHRRPHRIQRNEGHKGRLSARVDEPCGMLLSEREGTAIDGRTARQDGAGSTALAMMAPHRSAAGGRRLMVHFGASRAVVHSGHRGCRGPDATIVHTIHRPPATAAAGGVFASSSIGAVDVDGVEYCQLRSDRYTRSASAGGCSARSFASSLPR
jgi:hypothetical protein